MVAVGAIANFCIYLAVLIFITARSMAGETNLDLLERYPTTLTAGDTERARPWEFSAADLFRLSQFKLEVGKSFPTSPRGPADLWASDIARMARCGRWCSRAPMAN